MGVGSLTLKSTTTAATVEPALAFTSEELSGLTFYNVITDTGPDCAVPTSVVEFMSFDGLGNYTLGATCGGPGETGTYSVLESGAIEIVWAGGTEYISRISFNDTANGWRDCWASTEFESTQCVDLGYVFNSQVDAEDFAAAQNM